jgi:DNA-binding PadR family transcriptional regulator
MTTDRPTGYSSGGTRSHGPTGHPIGYWLKRLDRAIDDALGPTLAAESLARRHWQTMNFLQEGPSDAPALAEALRPFWGQGAITLDEVLRDLERRALIVNDGERYALTAAGKATRAKIAEHVNVTRSRLVDGVAREEYLATVDVLQRMAANLEEAPRADPQNRAADPYPASASAERR